ncbi:MAG: UTP--glucose-1-phosphate uridylyltransferase, partial [Puniceicoccales bacterium]|nr:UTP--glucose-1-phosphate uridylyltransferase [Puniceicoccales bacterium]
GQVFKFWDILDDNQRSSLIQQAEQIDLPRISECIRTFLFPEYHQTDTSRDKTFSPPSYVKLPQTEGDRLHWDEAYHQGETALAAGRVAVFTTAGGRGTRLGLNTPKGLLGVTPIRQKPLFQVLAEKIRFAEKKYGQPIHWFIMTSNYTHDETTAFFHQKDFFGIQNIHFFQQGLTPSVDFHGKILLAAKDRIAMQPDGHGGAIRALVQSGSTALLEALKVDIISFCQIENPLVNVIDPYFIGFHIQQKSQVSFRVICKKYPEEPVGIFATCKGKTFFIEHTDLTQDQALLKYDDLGKLKLHTANAGIHIFDRGFIQKLGSGDHLLPLHMTKKKIQTIDNDGNPILPELPNGIKLEHSTCDVLSWAKNFLLLEAEREHVFSPVKNAQGLNSLQTCHQDQLRLFAHWLIKAGVEIPIDISGLPPFNIEISPLFADNKRTFLEKWAALSPKPTISEGTYIE